MQFVCCTKVTLSVALKSFPFTVPYQWRKVSPFSQSLPISHILIVLRRKSADKAFLRRGNKRLRRGIESCKLFYLIMEDRICGIGEIYYCHCPAIQFIKSHLRVARVQIIIWVRFLKTSFQLVGRLLVFSAFTYIIACS